MRSFVREIFSLSKTYPNLGLATRWEFSHQKRTYTNDFIGIVKIHLRALDSNVQEQSPFSTDSRDVAGRGRRDWITCPLPQDPTATLNNLCGRDFPWKHLTGIKSRVSEGLEKFQIKRREPEFFTFLSTSSFIDGGLHQRSEMGSPLRS